MRQAASQPSIIAAVVGLKVGHTNQYRRTPGQLAAPELEVERIRGALHRAQELSHDAAAALEDAAH